MSNSKSEIQRRKNKAKTRKMLDEETPEQRLARLEKNRLNQIKRMKLFATNETNQERRTRVLLTYGKSVEYVVRKKPTLSYKRRLKREEMEPPAIKTECGLSRTIKTEANPVKTEHPAIVAHGSEVFEIQEVKIVQIYDYDKEEIKMEPPLDVVDIKIENE